MRKSYLQPSLTLVRITDVLMVSGDPVTPASQDNYGSYKWPTAD